jgi:AcrR family transcriptional regulator
VGSLYHHFGGKSELYVALWQEYQQAQEEAAAGAIAAAKRAGVTDPFELFTAGARAYLEGSWQHRDLTMLFLSGDTPPGFGVMARIRGHQWISQNDTLLGLSDTSFDRLYATILTSLIGEGAREVAVAKNRQQANRVTDAVIEYVQRIMADGPWSPAVKPVGADRAERPARPARPVRSAGPARGARGASASADAGSSAE